MLQRALDALMNPDLERTIREVLSAWPDPDPMPRETSLAWVMAARDELVSLLREVADDEQIAETLAVNYIELKSRWIALCTKANYQNFRLGRCDSDLALKGSACSQLLAVVEGLLTPEDVAQITEFLATPIRRAA